MTKSATDTMHDIINAAVVDAIVALKAASQGLPNALLRDVNAIHANTAFADLPEVVRSAVGASVRDAFAKLRKDGYVVGEVKSLQASSPREEPLPSRNPAHPVQRRSTQKPSPKARPRPKR